MAERVAHKIKQEQAEKERWKKTHHLKWRLGNTRNTQEKEEEEGALHTSITSSGRGKKQKRKKLKEKEKNLALVQEALHPKILYLDLVQTTSILLIPTLARMGQAYNGKVANKIWNVDHGMPPEKPATNPAKDQTSDLDPQPDDLLEVVLQSMWSVIRSKQNQTTRSSVTKGMEDGPNSAPLLLTAEMVQILLLENGEADKANDAQLVQEMVDVVSTTAGVVEAAPLLFDMPALVRALTWDLAEYPVGSEDTMSTYVYDILGQETLGAFEQLPATPTQPTVRKDIGKSDLSISIDNLTLDNDESDQGPGVNTTRKWTGNSAMPISIEHGALDNDEGQPEMPDEQGVDEAELGQEVEVQEEKLQQDNEQATDGNSNTSHNGRPSSIGFRERAFVAHSAKVIDTVVDSYGSTVTTVLIWITYVCHSGAYASLVLATDPFTTECPDQTFGCTLGKTVYTWLIVAVMLATFGFAVLLPLSYGNHPTKRDPVRMMVATVLAGVITL